MKSQSKHMLLCTLQNNKGKAIPIQALRVPGARGVRYFQTIGTWRWQGCQPHAPAAFTPRRYPSHSFHTTKQWFHNLWPRPSGAAWGYSSGSANSHSSASSLAPPACAWLPLINSWTHLKWLPSSYFFFSLVLAYSLNKRRSKIRRACHSRKGSEPLLQNTVLCISYQSVINSNMRSFVIVVPWFPPVSDSRNFTN